jgi:hypothetical protein
MSSKSVSSKKKNIVQTVLSQMRNGRKPNGDGNFGTKSPKMSSPLGFRPFRAIKYIVHPIALNGTE